MAENSKATNKAVFDRRKEYEPDKWRIYYDLEFFREELLTLTDSFIVIEEATGFINAFKELEMTDVIIGAQHNRNTLVFVFHSVSDVPTYIERLSDWLIITKTNDDLERIKYMRPRIVAILSDKESKYKNSYGDYYIPLNEL